MLTLLAMAGASIFYKLGTAPIYLWDESRLAVNALEMSRHAWSLVTTFDGAPDHWNTKPPLLIWVMAASIKLLGPNEIAVRLPSALAGLATVICVYAFTLRRLGSPLIALLAAAVLLATSGYLHDHAVRAGDYDALLTLWTTGFLFAGYAYLHPETRTRRAYLSICAVLVALAFLTKAIQGLILLFGLLIYAAISSRRRALLGGWWFWLHALALVIFMVAWYALREAVDPGYFSAANANDLFGRFGSVLEAHEAGPLFYVLLGYEFPFLIPGVLASAWLAWSAKGELRALGKFLLVTIAAYLIVISASRTKLVWYAIPLAPLCAIALAALVEHFRSRHDLTRWVTLPRIPLAAAVAIVLAVSVAVLNAGRSDRRIVKLQALMANQYSLFMRSVEFRNSGISSVVVSHPGFMAPAHWWPGPAQFYVEALEARGIRATLSRSDARPWHDDAPHVLSCGDVTTQLQSAGRIGRVTVVGDGHCGVYSRLD